MSHDSLPPDDARAAMYADDLERACLSAILFNPAEWKHIAHLALIDFGGPEVHRITFAAMLAGAHDYWSVCTYLRQTGQESYLAEVSAILHDPNAGGLGGIEPAWVAGIQSASLRRKFYHAQIQLDLLSKNAKLDPHTEGLQVVKRLQTFLEMVQPESQITGFLGVQALLQEPDMPDLIEDLFPVTGWGICHASEGQLKSFVGLDGYLHIATGKAWHGHAIKRAGPVLFVLNEGAEGFKYRVRGWASFNQIEMASLEGRVFVRKPDAHTPAFDVFNAAHRESLMGFITDKGIVAVCFDTFTSIIPGRNPNGADGDMGLARDYASEIAAVTRSFSLYIHHDNRQGEVKGATDFIYGADIRFSTKAEKDSQSHLALGALVHCEKGREDAPWPDMAFSAHVVGVPTEAKPHKTTLALKAEYKAIPQQQTIKLTQNEQAAHEALTAPMGYISWRDKSGVPLGSWRRVVKALCDKGLVQEPTGDGLYKRMPG